MLDVSRTGWPRGHPAGFALAWSDAFAPDPPDENVGLPTRVIVHGLLLAPRSERAAAQLGKPPGLSANRVRAFFRGVARMGWLPTAVADALRDINGLALGCDDAPGLTGRIVADLAPSAARREGIRGDGGNECTKSYSKDAFEFCEDEHEDSGRCRSSVRPDGTECVPPGKGAGSCRDGLCVPLDGGIPGIGGQAPP